MELGPLLGSLHSLEALPNLVGALGHERLFDPVPDLFGPPGGRGSTAAVAVGRAGWETPEGNFHVYQKVRDPIWEHPLTREVFRSGEHGNELGHYWIGFWSDGNIAIGFHGTPHPETVGKALSHGCVRMFAKDIGELFGQVSIGTLVSVVP